MWDHDGWGLGGWLGMLAMMVVFGGAFVALAVWLVRVYLPRPGRAPMAWGQHADELLAESFARGEIDSEEFARRRAVLDAHR